MQPHHRTVHIKEAWVESIAIAKIDRSHADSSSTIVASVTMLYSLHPELPRVLRTVLAKADINQKIAVLRARDKI